MGKICSIHGRDDKFIQNFIWKILAEETSPLGRPRHTCEYNSIMDLKEIQCKIVKEMNSCGSREGQWWPLD
jgi:hypothetical protein